MWNSGPYSTWEEALTHTGSVDVRAPQYIQGLINGTKLEYPPNEEELLSVDFIDQAWKDAGSPSNWRVVDVGGYYGVFKRLFNTSHSHVELKWVVLETPEFLSRWNRQGAVDGVEYLDSVDAVQEAGPYDCILIRNVVHAVRDYKSFLLQAFSIDSRYLVMGAVPLSIPGEAVEGVYCAADIPVYVMSENEYHLLLTSTWELVNRKSMLWQVLPGKSCYRETIVCRRRGNEMDGHLYWKPLQA